MIERTWQVTSTLPLTFVTYSTSSVAFVSLKCAASDTDYDRSGECASQADGVIMNLGASVIGLPCFHSESDVTYLAVLTRPRG